MSYLKKTRPYQIILLIAVTYLLVILGGNQWNPLELIRVGGHFDPRVGGQAMGYDGQFAYQIARDPINGWKYCDLPAYRYQRILYPVVVRILSLGQDMIIPWMMVLVNQAALIFSIYLLERILGYYQKPAWYALIYGLFIGTLMSLRLDLSEVLAYTLVMAAIWLWINQKHGLAILSIALAILCKEITILFLAAFAGSYLLKDWKKSLLWAAAGALPFVVWKIVLYSWFQDWGLNSGGAMATSFEWIPYFGWWRLALVSLGDFAVVSLLIFPLVILPSIIGLVLTIPKLIHKDWDASVLAVFFTSILVPFLPSSNILDPLGISRAIIGLVVAYLFYGAKQNSRRVLNYCLLFCITAIFVWGDSFLPVGTYK